MQPQKANLFFDRIRASPDQWQQPAQEAIPARCWLWCNATGGKHRKALAGMLMHYASR
jgi:hypothetical protein